MAFHFSQAFFHPEKEKMRYQPEQSFRLLPALFHAEKKKMRYQPEQSFRLLPTLFHVRQKLCFRLTEVLFLLYGDFVCSRKRLSPSSASGRKFSPLK
ncbi:hypothetical protein JCM10003_3945 [Bacteroides pyogenes JCM 10003]|nr:hypothetical protein JCM10003_3945 [Bacteroides pyogenes JCM 10003]